MRTRLNSRAYIRPEYPLLLKKLINDVLDALRKDTLNCAQGALLMARKRVVVDAKIAELEALRQLLTEEQQRLELSAEQQQARIS